MTESRRFLETHDVARTLGVTPEAIRYHVRKGHVQPAASTPRGALFTEADVEVLRRRVRRRRG